MHFCYSIFKISFPLLRFFRHFSLLFRIIRNTQVKIAQDQQDSWSGFSKLFLFKFKNSSAKVGCIPILESKNYLLNIIFSYFSYCLSLLF